MNTLNKQTSPVAGVILAGGLATRMGGGDKTLKAIGERKILDIVIERVWPQVSDLALNTNNDPKIYKSLGLPILPDHYENRYGPLAGILAGMEWARQKGYSFLVTIAGDTPFFPEDLVSKLIFRQKQGQENIVLAATRNRSSGKIHRHPTFGLWSVHLRQDLRLNLDRGVRKIVQWTDQHHAKLVEFPTKEVDPFFNINTPADLQEAENLIRFVK